MARLAEALWGEQTEPVLEPILKELLGTNLKPRPLWGRAPELAMLDGWLKSPGPSHAVLVGPPGCGKSTLLARWALGVARSPWERQVAFAPISRRFATAGREAYLRLLRERVDEAPDGTYNGWGDDEDGPAEWRARIATALAENSDPEFGHDLLVIVDGLDEAEGWRAQGDLHLPSRLGRGVRLLVSARWQPGADERHWMRRFGWARPPALLWCPPPPGA